jgi:hypothetical protein
MPVFAVILLAGVSAFTIWAFNALRTVRSAVRESWTLVEVAVSDRTALISKLADTVIPNLGEPTASQLQRAHERIGTVVGPRSVDSADRTLRNVIDPILDTLPTSLGLDHLKSSIRAANGAIDEAAIAYNENVSKYEATRLNGPLKLVASVMGFEREHQFRAEAVPNFDKLIDPFLLAH